MDPRRKANWARLIQKVYEVDPLECPNYGATMRIIALIEDAVVVERILKRLKICDPVPDTHGAELLERYWGQAEVVNAVDLAARASHEAGGEFQPVAPAGESCTFVRKRRSVRKRRFARSG